MKQGQVIVTPYGWKAAVANGNCLHQHKNYVTAYSCLLKLLGPTIPPNDYSAQYQYAAGYHD